MMSLSNLIFLCGLLLVAPYFMYLGFRPPKGLSPDVTGQSKFVQLISTTFLRPIIAVSGLLASAALLLSHKGLERLSFFTAMTSLAICLLILIPGCLCFIQQIGGRKPGP